MSLKEVVYTLLGRYHGKSEPEYNSGIPIELPTDVERPESIDEMIRRFIREDVSRAAVDDGDESFEEAEDFEPDSDEDVLPLTHHQVIAMDDDEIRDVMSSYGIEEAPQDERPTPDSPVATGASSAPKSQAAVTSAKREPLELEDSHSDEPS